MRIAAIPNKISTVGIEVPNKNVNTVYLREIIDSDAFKKSESKLTFSIGKDISGEAIVGNIAKLPHLLVAGTTGFGQVRMPEFTYTQYPVQGHRPGRS